MERKKLITCTALSILLSAPAWVSASQMEGSTRSEPGAQPQEQTQAQEGMQQDQIMNMQVNDITGKKVVNAQGEEIGEVDKIVKSRMSQDLEAVVSAGGFLGIGARQITVPIDQFSLQEDKLLLSSSVTEDELKQRPEYQESQYLEIEGDQTLAQASEAGVEGGTELSFQNLDQNKDGFISPEEAQSHEQLSGSWDKADQNSDNQIDQSEFSAFEEGQVEEGQEKEDRPDTPAGEQTQPGAEPGDPLLNSR